MFRTIRFIRSICTDKRGVTALEYAVLAALGLLAVTANMGTIKANVGEIFKNVNTDMKTVGGK
ncbi:MAG: hypothetical protein NVV74_13255 [Magnetospirillum sp.]|nr:hypothetical protein [Magnetospirillum sp.]